MLSTTRLALLSACVALSGSPTLKGQERIKECPYYPLQVGNRWTYRMGEQTVIRTVAKQERCVGVLCAVVETHVPGHSPRAEYLAVKQDGLYCYAFAEPKLPVQDPICVLKLPAKKGLTWSFDTAIAAWLVKGTYTIAEEELAVPAGKFKTVSVATADMRIHTMKVAATTWYARDIGPVKQTVTVDGKEAVLELKSFEPAKR